MSGRSDDPIVWSSEHGDQRREKGPERERAPGQQPAGDPRDGFVRVRRETKGRKGKGVTTISGVPLRGDALVDLAGELKRRCGTGGTVKDGVIEIQGDHRAEAVALLEQRGWKVKLAGG
jgi:translation initiation factor 1